MSLTKQEVAPSDWIATGVKTASKDNSKRRTVKEAEQLSTGRLLWIVVKRHKVGILAAGNIVLVLNWALPMWPEFVKSLFN